MPRISESFYDTPLVWPTSREQQTSPSCLVREPGLYSTQECFFVGNPGIDLPPGSAKAKWKQVLFYRLLFVIHILF